MPTLEALRRQVEGTEDLQSIVKAMKSISAVRIRQFRSAVESLDDYNRTLEEGFQIALRDRVRLDLPRPPPGAERVAVVFGSDQGMAGQFNTRIVEFARERVGPDPAVVHFFTVGGRVAGQLTSGGDQVDEEFPAPGSVDGITRIVHDLLFAVQEWREERGVEQFTLFYNDYIGGASYEPRRVDLLPVDPDWLDELRSRAWEGPSLPTYRTGWRSLFQRLLREHLFIMLYRACAESMAAENASRLSAMEAAESRIEERLGDLRQRLNQQRQQSITEELLEVVAGFEALEEEDTSRRKVMSRNLKEYKKKRDFRKTGEPDGGKSHSSGGPIWVIQEHDATSRHFDFRIEADGVLKSWAVPKGPSTDPSEKRLAVPTEDHPIDYADFEGVIPEGEYGAGSVIVWDRGTYENLKEDDDGEPVPVARQVEDGHVTIRLRGGNKIEGGYSLKRIATGADGRWLLVKMDDEGADARRNPVSTQPESVRSGRTVEEVVEDEGD